MIMTRQRLAEIKNHVADGWPIRREDAPALIATLEQSQEALKNLLLIAEHELPPPSDCRHGPNDTCGGECVNAAYIGQTLEAARAAILPDKR